MELYEVKRMLFCPLLAKILKRSRILVKISHVKRHEITSCGRVALMFADEGNSSFSHLKTQCKIN
jgi:hypothetical protein